MSWSILTADLTAGASPKVSKTNMLKNPTMKDTTKKEMENQSTSMDDILKKSIVLSGIGAYVNHICHVRKQKIH